jgi:DNA mismatch repair protein MutS
VPGAADKSYGIHVARLAGVPTTVNERAKEVLAHLEAEHMDETGRPRMEAKRKKQRRGDIQLTLFAPYDHPVIDKIRQVNLDEMTPLAALQLIQQWQREVESDR